MRQSFCRSRHIPKGFLVVLAIMVTLVFAQHGWSSPAEVSPQTLMTQIEAGQAPLILDVRSPEEFEAGHIPGAINIPYREIPQQIDELIDYMMEEVVIYCEFGVRAGIAEVALEQAGFQKVFALEGDIRGWRQAGFPIETRPTFSAP